MDALGRHLKRHTKGAKSAQDLGMIRSMMSTDSGFDNELNDNNGSKHKQSRFANMTNGISKAWKFAKSKGEEQKRKKSKSKKQK